jgi:hypothetical protein
MVSPDLIVGPSVGRAQIDVLELVVLKTEGDSNETAGGGEGALGRPSRQLHLNLAVVKDRPFHDCVCLTIGDFAIFGNPYRAFAAVLDGFEFDSMREQLIDGLSGQSGRSDRELDYQCREN